MNSITASAPSLRSLGLPGRIALACAALLILIAPWADAQVVTGQISGTVKDSSGAAIPGVSVAVLNQETSLERVAATNGQGFYVVSNLPPGAYEVRIRREGFKTFSRTGIVLSAGDRLDVSPMLELGSVAEVLTVTAQGEQVDTESATVARVVDGAQVQDLALNGRNLIQMAMIVPGVVFTDDEFDRGGWGVGSVDAVYVNGMRNTSNQMTIDGGYNQDSGNITTMTNNVSVDFVQEVKVASSGYSAEYGRNAGAQINFTTRSGTDQFHGTLFEFFRNDKLNARSFFAPDTETLRLNQFGWNLGGPVPALSSKGHNKVFFFAGQEYKRRIDGDTRRATLPTHAERAGIINSTAILRYPSNFPIAALRGAPIEDPSRASDANPGGRNILPRQYMTANGLAIMRIYDTIEPLASVYVDERVANNAVFQLANTDTRREDMVRVDYHYSPRNQFYVRYLYDTGSRLNPYQGGVIPTFQQYRRNQATNLQASWTASISASSINTLAATSSYLDLFRPTKGELHLPRTYGLKVNEIWGNDTEFVGIPSIAISGFTAISGAQTGHPPVWDFSVRDSFSRLLGKHNVKIGGTYIQNRKNNPTLFRSGAFTFNPTGNLYSSGNALIDTLIGNFRQYTETEIMKMNRIRMKQVEAYLADTWKARSNLTLDIGVRYHFFQAPVAADNTVSTFIPEFFDPAKAQRVVPTGRTAGQLQPGIGEPYNGIAIAGDGFINAKNLPDDPRIQTLFRGLPRGIYGSQHKFSPRFGFAYDPFGRGTFSLRGGAAIYYDRMPVGTSVNGSNPPFVNDVTIYDGSFDNPGVGSSARFPAGVTSLRPNVVVPTTYNWNLGIQQKLPFRALLDLNYVSTQGRHLLRNVDINQISPAVQYGNPGVNINALRPYQGYTGIILSESSASSNYHSLQAGVTRRYSKDLTFSLAYTWSKVLTDASANNTAPEDISNFQRERSHASYDRNHVLVLSYIYHLPFLRGRTDLLGKVAGGWQISGISQFQTGGWLTPSFTTPTGGRRPDRVGDVTYLNPREVQTLVAGNNQSVAGNYFFDPTPGKTFVAPPPDAYGNSAPFIIRGPGRNNWDLSLFKTFGIREGMNLQFRAEAFNIWNHASFRNPSVNAAARAYGTIADSGPPRLLQLALKLKF